MADLISRAAARDIIADLHGLCRNDVLRDTLANIDAITSVDAVPVEWLREFDLYYAGISGGSPYMKALIEAWKKEQEAQDG